MSYAHLWTELIEKRNNKLLACDWTQFADSPLSATEKAQWATYRQALRDIPNQLKNHPNFVSVAESNPSDGSIINWQWPTKPTT
jgi:hypothetical protein